MVHTLPVSDDKGTVLTPTSKEEKKIVQMAMMMTNPGFTTMSPIVGRSLCATVQSAL